MFLLIFPLIFVLVIFIDYLAKVRRMELTKDLSGPPIVPLIGSFGLLTEIFFNGMIDYTLKYVRNGERVVRFWAAKYLVVVTYDPKDIEEILSSSKYTSKGSVYITFKSVVGDGLFLSSGKKWQDRRKDFAPLLHYRINEKHIDISKEKCDILLEQWKGYLGKGAFDIFPYISNAILDTVGEAFFSVDFNAQTDSKSEFVRAYEESIVAALKRSSVFVFRSDILFYLLAPQLAIKQAKLMSIVKRYLNDILQKQKQMAAKSIEESTVSGKASKERKFLDMFIDMFDTGKPITDEEICLEMNALIFAAHDTMTSSIPFILYNIARHSDVQNKVFNEISEIFHNDFDPQIDSKKLNRLKYVETVIKESLRLYTSVPFISRYIEEDSVINGKTFPSGTSVIMPVHRLHNDPEYFSEPNRFHPERFSEGDGINFNTFTYIPFCAGPRNCLGQKMAMLTMKCFVVKILCKYELKAMGPEPKLNNGLLLGTDNGIYLGIKLRE